MRLRAVSSLRIKQPDAFAPLAGRQELDTAFHQRSFDGLQRADAGIHLAVLQPSQSIHRDNRLVRKVLLRPTKQSPRGSNLSWTDHAATIDRRVVFAT